MSQRGALARNIDTAVMRPSLESSMRKLRGLRERPRDRQCHQLYKYQ